MSKAAKSLMLALIGCCSVLAFATAQRGDLLLLDGKKYTIFTNPLEPYLERHRDRLPETTVVSTGLWRGYVATWEVKDGHLLLVDVAMLKSVKSGEKDWSTELSSVMPQMFPGEKAVAADWFSGHIIIPNGKLVRYVHMGYASIYKRYIMLRVEKGVLIRKWTTNAEGFIKFRDAQFASFKNTEEYRQALADTAKEGNTTPKENEEFLREYYSERYMAMIFDNPTPAEEKREQRNEGL